VKPAADEGEPLRGEAVDWLMRLQAAPGDTAVRAGLDTWLAASASHRRAWESVERVWRVSGGLPELDAPLPATNVVAQPRARRSRRVVAIAVVALAACLALYVAPIVQLWLRADHMTSIGELREVTLDDGTVVHLDADSAIAVRYGASRREIVLLAGRAFFQVTPANEWPFVVVVDDVTVTVTGTAFDVRSAGEEVTVAVQAGTVEVGLQDGAQLAGLLERGERLSIHRASRQATRSQVVPEDVAAWRQRRLVVDGASLAEVVEELGRHHAGIIMLSDRSLAARQITGVFDLSRPVEALNAIARTQHGSVTAITPYLLVVSGGS